jgi:hypothetical protein
MPERVDFAARYGQEARDVNTSRRKRAHLGIATDTFGPHWSPVRTAMCERPRPLGQNGSWNRRRRSLRAVHGKGAEPEPRSRPSCAQTEPKHRSRQGSWGLGGSEPARTAPSTSSTYQPRTALPAPDSAPGAGGASCPQRRPAPGMRESRRSGEGTGTRPGSGHEPLCGVAPRAYPPGVPGQAAASKPVSEASFFSSSSACFSI